MFAIDLPLTGDLPGAAPSGGSRPSFGIAARRARPRRWRRCSRRALDPPLFLCEGIGVYYPLIRHLGRDQPVYGLVTEIAGDYPRVEDLAAAYITEVRAMQPEGPYFLGGLSFGGIVAFEMGQQLFASGQEVAMLALFDTPTPWAAAPKPLFQKLAGYLHNVPPGSVPATSARSSGSGSAISG